MPKAYPLYIIDDHPSLRAFLSILCEERGLSCRCFENGEDFLALLGELEPGCVLLDMRMPKRSGLEVQAELVGHEGSFPVIAITGDGDVDLAVESMKLGALDFLEKPLDEEALFEAVDRAFAHLEGVAA